MVLLEVAPDLSRSRLQSLIRQGMVRIDGQALLKPAARVEIGAAVEIELPEPIPDEALPQDIPIDIVYEDSHVVVVDKAAGMVVHPGAGHHDGTLVNALLHHIGSLSGIGGVVRPGIVHRLDKGTSGLMVVAKNDVAHHGLADQFAKHTAGRRYLALCLGLPSGRSGVIRSNLARHRTARLLLASTEGSGKPACTHWRLIEQHEGLSLVQCRLETGRTHQIRVHLTEAGWPLVGDNIYKRCNKPVPDLLKGIVATDRPLLHAYRLSFEHPQSGQTQSFFAPVPPDYVEALVAGGFSIGAIDEKIKFLPGSKKIGLQG
ncbi:MAG: RluA family pseudouridine synthase [Proteobacteria bacterium]|nr:RluA family pseudouridine synthase [Pseudomonadota bacterium]